ncbi:ribosome biogenesis regulatory protein-like, partial [Scleropages formosus]
MDAMAATVEELLAKAEKDEAEKLKSIRVKKELELEFDLGNLLASDRNAVNLRDFRAQKKEDYLRALARDNTQLLVNELWKMPSERVEGVVVAKLPEPTTRLPREKPVPKPRPPTKWEQFAKLKGIQKKKKTNLVWDEAHKEWRRRWGYKRANDNTKDWLVEVPETADPDEDQFAKRAHAKRERVAKNELNRLRNIARAHKLKVPGAAAAAPSRNELARAEQVAKVSTASVGKFQERLPKEKAPRNRGKKRAFQPNIGDFSTERQQQLELLKMREEDMEAASKKRKGAGRKGRKGGSAPRGKAKAKGQGPPAGKSRQCAEPGRGVQKKGK